MLVSRPVHKAVFFNGRVSLEGPVFAPSKKSEISKSTTSSVYKVGESLE